MDYYNIIGEFINKLQPILDKRISDTDITAEIKAEAHVALAEVLKKYDLIK